MKKSIILLSFILFSFSSYSQKVKEKDIIGTWKLIIDVTEEMEKEAEDADTMFEEVFINAISGFVDGIIEDIDIYFDFRKDNSLKIVVHAYDEKETEYGTWFINRDGFLEIEGIDDDDHINIDADDDEWKLIDGILVNDEHEDSRSIYMTKID